MTTLVNYVKRWISSPVVLQLQKNTPASTIEQIRKYLSSCAGAFQIQILIGNSCFLANEAINIFGTTINYQKFGAAFKGAAAGTRIPSMVGMGIGLAQTATRVVQQGPTIGSILDLSQRAGSFLSAFLSSMIMLTDRTVLRPIANVFEGLGDIAEIAIVSDHIFTLNKVNTQLVSPDVKLAIEEEQKLFLLKWAKAITAFGPPLIAVLGLLLHGTLVPVAVILIMSVTSSCFAILNHFYKENMTFNDDRLLEKLRSAKVLLN